MALEPIRIGTRNERPGTAPSGNNPKQVRDAQPGISLEFTFGLPSILMCRPTQYHSFDSVKKKNHTPLAEEPRQSIPVGGVPNAAALDRNRTTRHSCYPRCCRLRELARQANGVWEAVQQVSFHGTLWHDSMGVALRFPVRYQHVTTSFVGASEAGGRAFESRPGHHINSRIPARSPKLPLAI